MSKKILYLVVGLLIVTGLGTGVYLYNGYSDKPTTATVKVVESKDTIKYMGRTGATALELLKEAATVVTKGEGENAYITTVNGKEADSKKEYWAFYINGTASMVGAGSYNTQSTDQIEWKLTTF